MVKSISEIMTRNVITITKGSSVGEAVRLMTKHRISCLIITDTNYKPVGIVTERDMVRRVLKNNLDIERTKIDEIMSSPVMTMHKEKRITDAIALMEKYHFRRVVVSDKDGKLLGVVTQSDLLLQVYEVKMELEEMNDSLRNTVKSLKRYNTISTESARIKALKEKIRRLEKNIENSHLQNSQSVICWQIAASYPLYMLAIVTTKHSVSDCFEN
jgi:CBS domain-containing protein